MSNIQRFITATTDILIETGKLYCLVSDLYPPPLTPKADRIYINDISLLVAKDWTQLYREDTNGFINMNSPFLVLDIGPSKLIELDSVPPTDFYEVWLYILFEERKGWVKVDTNRLEEII